MVPPTIGWKVGSLVFPESASATGSTTIPLGMLNKADPTKS